MQHAYTNTWDMCVCVFLLFLSLHLREKGRTSRVNKMFSTLRNSEKEDEFAGATTIDDTKFETVQHSSFHLDN